MASGSNDHAAMQRDGASTPALGSEEDIDANGQAVEILAGLTSLGISQDLREKVQQALSQLDQASTSAASALPQGTAASGGNRAVGPSTSRSAPGEVALRKQVEALEKKLAMSRSIMRKLYHKNVELEKEIQIMQVNSQPVMSWDMMAAAGTNDVARYATTAASGLPAPIQAALQERDRTISQLQQALDSLRRRCGLMEAQIESTGGDGGGPLGGGPLTVSSGAGSSQRLKQQQQQGLQEVLAHSALHLSKYQQIRDDYNRLLYKRTSAVSSSKAASQQARGLVDEMQQRLSKEIQEREAEAALYSARLYESEKQMSDWYAEKRVLEQHIARLNEEVAQRDRLDSEMEVCLCGMFEQLRMREEDNRSLTARLKAAGISVDADINDKQQAQEVTPKSE